MTGRKCLTAFTVVVSLAAPGLANAALVTMSSITAAWSDATGNPATYSGSGTSNASAHWGVSQVDNISSGYTLATVGNLTVDPAQHSLFDLGSFTHENFSIESGTGINGLRLTLTAMLSINGGAAISHDFIYTFAHLETPNWFVDDPNRICADGGANFAGVNINGCADRISIMAHGLSDTFVVDGMGYALEIAGFQIGNRFATDFWTAEKMSNLATLKGEFVATGPVGATPVPEPFSLAIFGTALLGLGSIVYHRRG